MSDLAGMRVLIVEDEPMIAVLVEDILIEAGCEVLGPLSTFSAGLEAALTGQMDIAVLDVNLRGQDCYAIGSALSKRGIPFVLTSGYGEQAGPPNHPEWPVCAKPFDADQLVGVLSSIRRRSDPETRRLMDRNTEERIRRRAYELWLLADKPEGSSLRFWKEAEAQIAAKAVSLEKSTRSQPLNIE